MAPAQERNDRLPPTQQHVTDPTPRRWHHPMLQGALSQELLSHILNEIGKGNPSPEKIDILMAIRMAIVAWRDNVSSTTVANCFGHCRIFPGEGADGHSHVGEGRSEQETVEQELRELLASANASVSVEDLLDNPEENLLERGSTMSEIVARINDENRDEDGQEGDEREERM